MSNENKDPYKKDNLEIWGQVETTPPSATRGGQVDGRFVTTISPTHMIKMATKVFGPAGLSWGYEIIEERFDNGRPIYLDGEMQGHEILHTIRLKLWRGRAFRSYEICLLVA